MTDLVYLTDSYKKELNAKIVSLQKRGSVWELILDKTIFYPQGGGQPSDKGEITGVSGKAHVKHVRMQGDNAVHECSIDGNLEQEDEVHCIIDWNLRYHNMRVHSAGHIMHEAVMSSIVGILPLKGEHGKDAYIEYKGSIPLDNKQIIELETNAIVQKNLKLTTEFVSLEELQKRSSYVPEHLPKHKPLRILEIEGYQAIPDGGTQVARSSEVGPITITTIENIDETVRVHYAIEDALTKPQKNEYQNTESISRLNFIGELQQVKEDAEKIIMASNKPIDLLRLEVLGAKSDFTKLTRQIRLVPSTDRAQVGIVVNQIKSEIEKAIRDKYSLKMSLSDGTTPGDNNKTQVFDPTMPGIRPPEGHLHIVTQAISEITQIFAKIGFTRVRYPEIDWDWYAFESLNMPANHPARDEWETFFIESSVSFPRRRESALSKTQIPGQAGDDKGRIVLTPHTSNGQVREMEKGKLPIRMINIAKCYRRQTDISHVPMFHQFEGMYIDKNVSITHLKGFIDFFVKNFFGPERKSRLRPFHFQFTEPSFEVDISCDICSGKGCRLCKEGWLELAGSGMIHPNVLRSGGIDPNVYSGFAIGWGVERTYMMKAGTKLNDIRLLYSNDMRFLEQF